MARPMSARRDGRHAKHSQRKQLQVKISHPPETTPIFVSTAVQVEGPTKTQVKSTEGTLYAFNMTINRTIDITQVLNQSVISIYLW